MPSSGKCQQNCKSCTECVRPWMYQTADETSADADGRMSNGQKQRASSRRRSMSKPIVWLKIKHVWYLSKGSLICTWNSSRGDTLSSMRPSGVKFLKIKKKKIHLSYNTLQTKM